MLTIVPVVEGDGDAAALPVLLARILQEKFSRHDVFIAQGKARVVKANGRNNLEKKLDKFLGYAQKKPGCGAILILVDSDADCPVMLAQQLSQRSEQIGVNYPVQIVCAYRSYESWFLASLDSVKGHFGIPENTTLTDGAEDVPNPKQWISNRMPAGQAYKETIHQVSLSRAIDLELAYRNSRSFRRLCHALEQLLLAVDALPRTVIFDEHPQ